MSKKLLIKIHDTKTFDDQDRARKYILDITNAGVLFFNIHEKEDKDNPKPEPKPKVIDFKPMLKKAAKKKAPVEKKEPVRRRRNIK